MAWNDAPPSAQELKPQSLPWDAAPPTKDELATDKVVEPEGLLSKIGDVAASAGKAGLGLLAQGGRKIDSYTGAPVRAAVGAAQDGNSPLTAAASQFGEDPGRAPTGKDIVMRAGLDDKRHLSDVIPGAYMDRNKNTSFFDPRLQKGGMLDPSTADAAGTAVNVATDPLTFIPGGLLAKGTKAAAETKLGSKAAGLLGKAGTKVGEALTGVPEKEIATYAKKADEIKAMAKASDRSTAEAADSIRAKFSKDIQKTRQGLNNQIGSTLEASDKAVDAAPILDALEGQKAKINMKLNPEDGKQIDDLIAKIKGVVGEDGTMAIKDAHDVKTTLQSIGSPAYGSPGQIFQYGKASQQAAKSGAAVARTLINEAEPAVASANNQLYKLHQIEDKMNPNLLATGKPEAGLLSAGTGGNPRNAKNLEELGRLTGTDMQGEAEKLAAMRTFGSPKLMPADTTGKAVGRIGLGAGLGFLIGHTPGAIVGGALTSPAALKTAIDAGQFAGRGAKYAEPTGLLLNQLSHQGQQSIAPEGVPPGLIYQSQAARKKEPARKSR